MKQLFFLYFSFLFFSCQSDQTPHLIYQTSSYSLYKSKIVQGKYVATVVSPQEIISNYESTKNQTFSNEIMFKFSINEKDNELPFGVNHIVRLSGEKESPIITFGQINQDTSRTRREFLPVNYTYTFRVNLTPIFEQFDKQGFYITYSGDRIAKSDFKGVYIAGGSDPLSWDFVNLGNKKLQLLDTGKDHIYTITLTFNPYNEKPNQIKKWKLEKNLTTKAKYHSDQPIVDALYNLSLEEAIKNIEPDSTLRTGAKWGGVWTRDISYSILLAFAFHEPEIAKISLMKKVNRGRIIQDTGSGGAWPISSDRTIWAIAAWEIYKVTDDNEWLKKTYHIIKNTLDDDAKTLGISESGLYKGESSFLDWREQTYPKWMNNADIFMSENLGTNVIHFQAHQILVEMAKILNQPTEPYQKQADKLKKSINENLWQTDRGYYGQYRYGQTSEILSPRFEALGEALSILFDVADEKKAKSIMENSPVTEFGTTCIYPQISNIPPYHNNAIWPFVQAYWNLAAAKTGNEKALVHGLSSIYRAAGLFLTHYENMVASNGDFEGTEINSDRMLWSMAGNLAMVYRVFIGMNFEPDGIRFQPTIPEVFGGEKSLTNFKYRKSNLTISVLGFGKKIKSFIIDGNKSESTFFPGNLTGNHTIIIEMDDETFDYSPFQISPNHFSLSNPKVELIGNKIQWNKIEGAKYYQIYENGKLLEKTTHQSISVEAKHFSEFQITAVDSLDWESFSSEPILVYPKSSEKLIEIEDFYSKSSLPFTNFKGKGFIELSNKINPIIKLTINSETEGSYVLDFRYSNGSGPWNTDNKCAIRSLYLNNDYVSSIVFPQRGTNEWSDWGWSNPSKIKLKKGKNIISLSFELWNQNMNVETNRTMLDQMRIIKMNDLD